jgi:glycerol-3-phosphate acyltransferase PlsY
MGALLLVALSFVLGSFPSGVVLARLAGSEDPRRIGSGNIGAANVARAAGFKVGVAVAVLDALKGLLAVAIAGQMGAGASSLALVAVAAVAGHDFSVFLHFRGGKGVATTVGAFLALAPVPTLLAAVIWVAVLLSFGYSSLASLVALALLPLLLAVAGAPPAYVVAAGVLFFLGTAKHIGNIGRLLAGTEPGRRRRAAGGG